MLKFNRFNRILTACLACLLSTQVDASSILQDSVPEISASMLESLAFEARDSFGVPGFAIGVIKDGKIILNRGFGFRQNKTQARVDSNTLFAIASNTKAFVGTTASILEADGKLNLNDKVSTYLPYLRFADDNVSALTNVADLMSHRIGLGTFKGDHLWFKRQLTPKQVLTKVESLTLEYPFRAGYGYSNLGFIAAGEVISKAAGMPWQEYMSNRIFEPLGMKRTTLTTRELETRGNFASGHISRQENTPIQPVSWDLPGAAGGIWSSSSDMLKWIDCNLNGGVFAGDTIWAQEVQQTAWKPHNTFGDWKLFTSYGLGWFEVALKEHRILSHGGGYDGMYSQVMLVPEKKLGIVVLTNSMTGLSSALSKKILALYLQQPNSEQWLTNAMNRQRKGDKSWFERQDSVDLKLKAVRGKPDILGLKEGLYADANYGTFKITKSGSVFTIQFPNAVGLNATLEPFGGDHYRIVWDEQHAWFDKGLVYLTNQSDEVVLQFYIPNDDIFYDSIRAIYQD